MKKIISLVLTLILFCSVLPVAYAEVAETPAQIMEPSDSATPRAEQTEWIYRYNSELGIYEKRLWSYTYGVWLTDWLPCD